MVYSYRTFAASSYRCRANTGILTLHSTVPVPTISWKKMKDATKYAVASGMNLSREAHPLEREPNRGLITSRQSGVGSVVHFKLLSRLEKLVFCFVLE